MADYPTTLPVFVSDGHGYEDQDMSLRMPTAAGPDLVRQTVRQSYTLFSVRGIYAADQMAIFEGWFKHVLGDGVEWFDVGLDVGQGLTEHTAQFKGKYKASRWGRYWVVDAVLKVLGRTIMTEAEYDDVAGVEEVPM